MAVASAEDSLEALVESWLEDSDGYYRNIGKTPPATPSWSTLGEILQAARSYE